jgi:putative iron-only hydrogenase system regulator
MSKRIAVIGAILEEPREQHGRFNEVITQYQHMVHGRMGLPFHADHLSVISLVVAGTLDEINGLTGKLGSIPGISVKTSISKREVDR